MNSEILFSGLIFWGSEFLPKNIKLTLENIRNWAIENKLIDESKLQFITSERANNLKKHFSYEDELQILISIYKEDSGNLSYLEYPFIPIKTLIKKSKEISIVYWQIIPTIWNPDGSVEDYGEVHLGFWCPDIPEEEFCSLSNAKLVIKKFYDLYNKLPNKYAKKTLTGNILDITTDGEIKAVLFKTGRLFDVEFRNLE